METNTKQLKAMEFCIKKLRITIVVTLRSEKVLSTAKLPKLCKAKKTNKTTQNEVLQYSYAINHNIQIRKSAFHYLCT